MTVVKVFPEEGGRKSGMAVMNPGEGMTNLKTEQQGFFKQKGGSLFPKKRSVKKMMLDWLINSFSSVIKTPNNHHLHAPTTTTTISIDVLGFSDQLLSS